MSEALTGHLTVSTCIGCGRRNRAAECPEGCTDVPLDLVDGAALQAFAAATESREDRIAPLKELTETVAAGAVLDWQALRERARAALRLPAPDLPDVEIIQAWGCPRCGRIDAPQPCLGICVFHPRTVADAREYRQLAPRADQAVHVDQALSGIARIIAAITPRPGREEATTAAMREKARHTLDQIAGSTTSTGPTETHEEHR